MAIKVVGLVDCFDNPEFGPLTKHRPLASTSFLGRYTFIDFPLSNFLNSGIHNMGILCRNHIRSLTKHVGNGRSWIQNTKLGSLETLYDEPNVANPAYNTDVADLEENFVFLRDLHPDYVIITFPMFVYEVDYKALLEEHIASGKRISVLYKHFEHGLKENFFQAETLEIGPNGTIKNLGSNMGENDSGDVGIGTLIMDYPELESLLEYAKATSSFFGLRDCLKYLAPTGIMRAVEYKGYVRLFDSLSNYLKNSLELLDRDTFNSLFKDNWTIHTRTYDTPPTVMHPGAVVKNAYLANGCDIFGTVTNSIIARNVKVGKGAVLNNCVVLNDVEIAEGTHIENAVIDRDAKILHMEELSGTLEDPIYVARGDIV